MRLKLLAALAAILVVTGCSKTDCAKEIAEFKESNEGKPMKKPYFVALSEECQEQYRNTR